MPISQSWRYRAVVFLGEKLTPANWFGVVLILAGVFLVSWKV
ncbi:MAG: EamA family transporter [Rhizobiaceae bacterium]